MIVLDTNVVSELMVGGSAVEQWIGRVPPGDLYTTAMTRAEIGYGIALLQTGRRRDELAAAAALVFAENDERLLAFDARSADRYGEILARRRSGGRPMSVQDAVIASITWAHRATLATRNVKDFEGCDIEVVNPFES